MPSPQTATESEAISTVFYNLLQALDTNDATAFHAAWLNKSALFDRNGEIYAGLPLIKRKIFSAVANIDTHHLVGNVQVQIGEDGQSATMTSQMLAQHHRRGEAMDPDAKGFFGGSSNTVELGKDGAGEWKISKWAVKITWVTGDPSIVALSGD